jgi:hypothetical protein
MVASIENTFLRRLLLIVSTPVVVLVLIAGLSFGLTYDTLRLALGGVIQAVRSNFAVLAWGVPDILRGIRAAWG